MNTKMSLSIFAVVFFCVFNAKGQINLLSNDITFRTPNTSNHGTDHYGDLNVYQGNNNNWGWLYCEHFFCPNDGYFNGSFYAYDKHFIQPHPTDTSKIIVYSTIESGEALTIARGRSVTKG
jgi:hypothetical protein